MTADCSQPVPIVNALLAATISIAFGRAAIWAWRDPESFKLNANGRSQQQKEFTLVVFRFLIPVIVVLAIGTVCRDAALLIWCGAGSEILKFLAVTFKPLAFAAPAATSLIAAAVGTLFWWFSRRLPVSQQIVSALFSASFAFAGLQAASFHVGEMAERWGLICFVIVLLMTAYRGTTLWLGRRGAAG